MRVFMRVHACSCVCMSMCMCAHVCACSRVCARVLMHVHVHACACVLVCACSCACTVMRVHARLRMHVFMVCVLMRVCSRASVCARVHPCMCACSCVCTFMCVRVHACACSCVCVRVSRRETGQAQRFFSPPHSWELCPKVRPCVLTFCGPWCCPQARDGGQGSAGPGLPRSLSHQLRATGRRQNIPPEPRVAAALPQSYFCSSRPP